MASRTVAGPSGAPVCTSISSLAPIAGGISVMGVVEATVVHQCRRCLTDWTEDVVHNVTQVITIKGDDEDEYRLHGDLFDFEDLVRDELMLSLPIAPRCGPDCVGLVVEERNDLNTRLLRTRGGIEFALFGSQRSVG